jgi:hypothetical protein
VEVQISGGASLRSPEEVEQQVGCVATRGVAREPLEEFVPHVRTSGMVARGKAAEGTGFPHPWTTKQRGCWTRANSARGFVSPGKLGEPPGKCRNQTSP